MQASHLCFLITVERSMLRYQSYYHLHSLSNNLSSFHYVLGTEDISLNKTDKISNLTEFTFKSITEKSETIFISCII